MEAFLKRSLKLISYSALALAGVVASGVWHDAGQKSGHTVTRKEEIKNSLFAGIAHADAPCSGYGCASLFGTSGGGGDGGGDCGDGGGGDDCN